MMAQAIWKGAISFGLVSIPVNLHTAVQDRRPYFRMLHAKDQSPIAMERLCRKEGQPVAWEDLVKGYEYERGRFVTLTREDFETAMPRKDRTLEILHFVSKGEIEDRYCGTPYFLVPGKGGERAYAVLREAIRSTKKVGIAKFVLRDRQHLAVVSAMDKALLLTMLRFADELVGAEAFSFPDESAVRPQELTMAKTLIDGLTEAWKPDQYTDDYRINLMRIIQAKLKGKKPSLEEAISEPPEADVVDLMSRLRRSLEETKQRKSRKQRQSKSKSRTKSKKNQAA